MKQSEALRLADELDVGDFDLLTNYAAAEELRRLHEANQAMLGALTWIADQTYDPWTNGYEAQRVAAASIDKATGE